MRKVILGAGITLDGYIARPNGSVDYLVMTKEGSADMASFFATIDTIVMGRKTLDAAIAMMGGSFKSPVDIPTYVFSRTQPPGERDGVIFTNQSPASFLRKIRARLEAEGLTCCYLDGRTRGRKHVVAAFNAGAAPVFLISLKAGGTGLNLTQADHCFLLDP